jgi:hypothetical protein
MGSTTMSGSSTASAEPQPLAALRRFLLGVLLLGAAGMGTELLLIGHVEGAFQLTPVALLASGVLILAWLALAPARAAVRAVRAVMALFVASGVVGVVLHYQGNQEFELEIYPDMAGMELVRETLTGATPVLAPGSMALLGLVGLAVTLHHPASLGRRIPPSPGELP